MAGDYVNNGRDRNGTVLLNEPDESVRDALTVLLEGRGWTVHCASNCEGMVETLKTGAIAAVISESNLPDCTPEEILERCKAFDVPVIFTGHDLPLQGAVDLIRQGAIDFLDKPFPQSRLLDLLDRLQLPEAAAH